MGAAPLPPDEVPRLAALYSLQILDTPPEARFDRITRLVATHFGVALVELNFIDADRQWTKSHIGPSSRELARSSAFCAHTILENEVMCIVDARADARFADNPLVTGAPALRFYAGVPIRDLRGYAVGSLCMSDVHPRQLTDAERADLYDFAVWAEQEVTRTTLSTAVLQLQATEDALRVREAHYQTLLTCVHEGIIVQGGDGQVQRVNPQALQLLGVTEAMLRGEAAPEAGWYTIHEDGRPFPFQDHPGMRVLHTSLAQQHIVMGVHKPDETITWIMINAQPLPGMYGQTLDGVISSFVDITHLKAVEQQLHAQQAQLAVTNAQLATWAMTDALTGVLNRRAFMEELARLTYRALHTPAPLALILVDVDHFKAFNDRFGHVVGDAVLHQVAQLLCTQSRAHDLVARYGGEEFAVVLPDTDAADAVAAAERLRHRIATHPWSEHPITVSMGVAWMPSTIQQPTTLLEAADEALYAAKRQGRNGVAPMREHGHGSSSHGSDDP